jgi:hypothetical protein
MKTYADKSKKDTGKDWSGFERPIWIKLIDVIN